MGVVQLGVVQLGVVQMGIVQLGVVQVQLGSVQMGVVQLGGVQLGVVQMGVDLEPVMLIHNVSVLPVAVYGKHNNAVEQSLQPKQLQMCVVSPSSLQPAIELVRTIKFG